MRRVTFPAATLLLLVLISPSAWAQPVTAPASTDPDIQHLLELTGSSRTGATIASLISSQILKQVHQEHPNIPPRAIDIASATLDEEFKAAFAPDGEFMRDIAAIWSKHFTHEEILGLIAFYETPLGRKVTDTLPAVAQESAQAGMAWGQGKIPEIVKKVQDRLRAEGLIK